MEMDKEWITLFNKKCAEFMGWRYVSITSINFPNGTWSDLKNVGHCAEKGLRFHNNWEWIIPVLEKIENIKGLDLETSNNWIGEWTISLRYLSYSSTYYVSKKKPRVNEGQDFRTKKEAIVKTIDDFIDWYNKQNL